VPSQTRFSFRLAVHHEVVVAGDGLAGAIEVRQASWLQVIDPARIDIVAALEAAGLHAEESAAIALACEKKAEALVIDERQGRATAAAMGLRFVGTIGVLVAARVHGQLPAVAPEIERLRAAGLWLSEELIARVLADVGEAPARQD
jgi:predicted nucleic acid-binding protein